MQKSTSVALALVCAALGGALLARVGSGEARAQEGQAAGLSVECRLFPVDLDKDRALRTSDRTTEVGQWIGEREAAGWTLYSVDFEVGQKSTGYPQGWNQVCVYPAR